MNDMPVPETALEQRRRQKIEEAEKEADRIANLTPDPVGWSLLVAIPDPEQHYDSGLAKAAETQRVEQILASIGMVVAKGPCCYNNKDKFGDVHWCEVGDFVMFRPNSGTRFRMGGKEYRLLNDDTIEATIPDPSLIEEAR